MQLTIEYTDGSVLHLLYDHEWDINTGVGFLEGSDLIYDAMRDAAERGQEKIGNIFAYKWEPI